MISKPEYVQIRYIVDRLPASKPTIYKMIESGEFPAPDIFLRTTNRRFWLRTTADAGIAKIMSKAVVK